MAVEGGETGRTRRAVWLAASFVLGLAVGFVPQWWTTRDLRDRLAVATHRLDVARLGATLGAALAEADLADYERARQLASSFYIGLEELEERVGDEAQAAVLADIARERDETITLLSRALPDARARLASLYARYHAAMGPPRPAADGPATPRVPGPEPPRGDSGEARPDRPAG